MTSLSRASLLIFTVPLALLLLLALPSGDLVRIGIRATALIGGAALALRYHREMA